MAPRNLAVFGAFTGCWIAASALGWWLNLQVVAAGVGLTLGTLIALIHQYSDSEYWADLDYGFAYVAREKRASRATWVAVCGIIISSVLIFIPFLATMDALQFATPALGGLLLPHCLKFLLQSRRIEREGTAK